MNETYNDAITSMLWWREVEKWVLWTVGGSPLLLFLRIPLDLFLVGWFLLVAFAIYAHCSRLRWRRRAIELDPEFEEYA
jgi:hypothetical protein